VTDTPLPDGIQLTPFDPAFREDPYPILHDLRRRAPVHRDEPLKRWIVTRHDDVEHVLRNKAFFVDPSKARPDAFHRLFENTETGGEQSILFLDDPQHRRLRGLVNRTFRPRAIDRMRPEIRKLARDLVAQIETPEFDVVEALANPLPALAIAVVLGVDGGDQEQFKRWSEASTAAFFNPFASEEERAPGVAASQALREFFLREVDQRRREPSEDLIGRMCAVEDERGDRMTDAEINTMCNLLLIAGNVTTTDLIGNGTRALMDHPEQAQTLRAAPELMPHAVEEMLRYDAPVMNSARITHDEVEIGGVAIGKGESVMTVLGAANRDPDIYPEPDRLDFDREDVHHQSFGGGQHLCLGSHLARLEAQEGFAALLERFPKLGPSSRPHEYRQVPSFRGLKHYWLQGSE